MHVLAMHIMCVGQKNQKVQTHVLYPLRKHDLLP